MIVKFEFDTTSEDFYDSFDHIKLYNMQKADDMALCLNALREKVRSLVKYDEREMISKDEIEETFWEIIKDHDINFEKMRY